MKIGDKAITKYSKGASKHKEGEIVTITGIKYKNDGITKIGYTVRYSDGET